MVWSGQRTSKLLQRFKSIFKKHFDDITCNMVECVKFEDEIVKCLLLILFMGFDVSPYFC